MSSLSFFWGNIYRGDNRKYDTSWQTDGGSQKANTAHLKLVQ